jgi:hypothetical protein
MVMSNVLDVLEERGYVEQIHPTGEDASAGNLFRARKRGPRV